VGATTLLLLLGQSLGDLPVHCQHKTVKGKWEFSMSHGDQPKTVSCIKPGAAKTMCFYGSCSANKVLGEPNFKVDKKWTVSLANPNVALATDDKGKKHKGSWTSVYDEGFEVNVGGRNFFAFSKFDHGKSECAATFPGWHRDQKNPDAAKWGCYTGSKKSEEIAVEHLELLSIGEIAAHQEQSRVELEQSLNEATEVAPIRDAESKSAPPKFQADHNLISRINSKATTWKAKVYPEYSELTVDEFKRRSGHAKLSNPLADLPIKDSLLEVDTSDLPETFDWRNKDGQNYIDPVVNQACGSCYAVSSVSMLNSRIRIKTKNRVKPSIPYHQVLSCDRYDQGCAGGYPFLVQKYSMEFGLTKSGSCAKSKAELEELGESERSTHEPFIRAKSYEHIGGFQGATTTSEMMREIHDNGPVVIGLNGGYELMHYESGVFIETGEAAKQHEAAQTAHKPIYFEATDHAVLVVGWGKDAKNNKHWIVKNSYGANWGEKGYFKIPRKGDADGVLSITTAAVPVLGDSEFFEEQSKQHKTDDK